MSSGEGTYVSLEASLAQEQLDLLQQITTAKLGLIGKDRLISKLQKECNEKDKTIFELRSRIDETVNINTRRKRNFQKSDSSPAAPISTAEFSAQTPCDFFSSADFGAQMPSDFFSTSYASTQTDASSENQPLPPMSPEALHFCLQLQSRVSQLEEKFLDWEEGKMHDMFVRLFRDEVQTSSPKSPVLSSSVPPSTELEVCPLTVTGKNPVVPNCPSMPATTASSNSAPSDSVSVVCLPATSASSKSASSDSVSAVCPRPLFPLTFPVSASVSAVGCRPHLPTPPAFSMAASSASVTAGRPPPTMPPPFSTSTSSASAVSSRPHNSPDNVQSSSDKSALLVGDSLIRYVNCNGPGFKFNKTCLPGASVSSVSNFFSNSTSSVNHDIVFIHCGTNSIKINDVGYISNSDVILRDFKALFSVLKKKYSSSQIVIIGFLFRRDLDFNSLLCINDFISNLCQLFNFTYVDPSPWISPACIGRDGLHLNRKGSFTFSKLVKHVSERLFLRKN